MSSPLDCTLSLLSLPKKLTSRRNLHVYFSKFGEVVNVSVNKAERSGMVQFSSNSEAKTAKSLGKLFEGKPFKILWTKNTLKDMDLRAKKQEEVIEIDSLWQEDDKECFGVEIKPAAQEGKKKSAKDILSQHLKLSGVKKRLVSVIKTSAANKSENSGNKISPIKLRKQLKPGTLSKKTPVNKRKLSRKEETTSDELKKKIAGMRKQTHQIGQALDQIDLKEKLALLDERDKLIRQQTVHDSNINTALKGTCPDMCPERERILRQCGQAVAVYELVPGTNEMDESKAVKEYSRSSADQGVPLPHELRPEPVLSMTMSYLITNVINKIDNPDENKAVWYSFCWNRLRSIRKDIKLQQLTDLETVKIVEQCARFHICCYDHMWGAEVSGFDDRINANNLMDCLQTLIHLYEDLAKRNIKCPNEPEFYSYLILLKLNTGDVIWEYQQYAPEIQLSPKVQFAITVHLAFKNNMYSKYFSLVKQASYLEACLLQRHFDEVRTKALQMMLKAYSLPNRNIGLTTSFVMKCLKFDSKKNVLRFCEKVEGYLDKKIEFEGYEDEDEYVTTSSYIIREKRLPIANAVVGENNPLPIYVPHQAHSSFDENGRLREPLQLVPDETYASSDSPLDESDMSVPEVEPQLLSQSEPFKFSLMTEGNIFSKNRFSRLGSYIPPQDNLINVKSGEDSSAVLKSSELHFSSKDAFDHNDSFYEDGNTKSFKIEENIDEEMVYDENYDEETKRVKSEESKQLFTQFSFEHRPHFGFQQSFSGTSIVPSTPAHNENTFIPKKQIQADKFFSTVISPKGKTEGNVTFSLNTSHIEKAQISNSVIYGNSPFERFAQLQKVSSKIEGNTDETNHFLLPQHDIKSKVNNSPFGKLVQFQQVSAKVESYSDETNNLESNVDIAFRLPQKSIRYDLENIENNRESERESKEKENKEILEKLLLEKAEKERIKMEEAKRAELERQKKIEKQKALESLRKDLGQRMKAKNAKKYARIWKSRVEKLKEKRADFPMLYELSVESHLRLWGRMKYIPMTSVYQRAKDRKNLNTIVSQVLTNGVTDSYRYISLELAELLAKSASRTMNLGRIQPIYWKLAMSLPWVDRSTSEFSVFNNRMRRCCKQTFYKKAETQLGSVECCMTSLQIPVHVSVHFSDDLESCSSLHGMDALIFVVVDGFESEKTCLDRLRNLVTSQARSSEISVSVMTINGNKFDRSLKMELKELQEQNLVAHWAVSTWTDSDSLLGSLAFLAEHVNVVLDICAKPLESLVTEAFDDFIYDVEQSQAFCPNLVDALQNPNIVITLYNTFLTKLEDLLLSSKLEKHFNFAEEFKSYIPTNECGGPEVMCGKQYNNQYKYQISNKINSLKLPELSGWPNDSNQIDFNSLADLVDLYCRTKIDDTDVSGRVIRKLAREVADPSNELNCYSWLHIIEMLAESRMSRVFSAREKDKKMFVMFNKKDLQRMIKKQWWILLPIVANAKSN